MKTLLIIPLLLLLFSCSTKTKSKSPKYIFLCIGDGMGQAQIQAADLYLRETTGDSLDIMYLPVNGDQFTYSANSNITCSSASGTAYSTGHKANNGQLCIGPESGDTLYSVAKSAKESGMKVGIISCVPINHATPAVFYSHNESRNNYYEIALDLPKSGYDYFAGGGFKKAYDTVPSAYANARKFGYELISNQDSLEMVPSLNKKVLVYNPNEMLPYAIDKEDGFTLADLTRIGIKSLDNPDGFFMMVEGGKIDWACHANDVSTAIHEVIAFNNAVKEIIKFYNEHKDETLIIVTADHETGGLGIGSENYAYQTNFPLLANQSISSGKLEWLLREEWNAEFTFDNYFAYLTKYFNFNVEGGVQLTDDDMSRLKKAFEFAKDTTIQANKETQRLYDIYEENDYSSGDRIKALTVTPNAIIGEKAGLGWTTFAHTAVQVPVRAMGVKSELFESQIDNTQIALFIFDFIKAKQ